MNGLVSGPLLVGGLGLKSGLAEQEDTKLMAITLCQILTDFSNFH